MAVTFGHRTVLENKGPALVAQVIVPSAETVVAAAPPRFPAADSGVGRFVAALTKSIR